MLDEPKAVGSETEVSNFKQQIFSMWISQKIKNNLSNFHPITLMEHDSFLGSWDSEHGVWRFSPRFRSKEIPQIPHLICTSQVYSN